MQSLAFLVALAAAPAPAIQREEFRVTTDDGVGLAVRQVRSEHPVPGVDPFVLLHGARVPGIPSFDLPVPGGSLAADLVARTGAVIFVPDARGYGRSDRPPEMDRPANQSRPLARAYLVLRDVDAVVRAVQQRTQAKRVTLLGWATGGLWAGFYASLQPERVGHLVLLNALYGGSDRHSLLGPGSPTADPAHPDRLDPALGGYGRADAAALLRPWDRSIPEAERAGWRDPAVAQAYVEAALASDPASGRVSPAALRAPTGALEDSFLQASGRRLYDAGSITAAVLLVRGGRDFWSRPEDVQAFQHDAVHAASVEVLAPLEALHFLHLDRPEHGREALLSALQRFLAPAPTPRRATSP
jgi:pimeloyl-ACP methyl ester carboxylesterase